MFIFLVGLFLGYYGSPDHVQLLFSDALDGLIYFALLGAVILFLVHQLIRSIQGYPTRSQWKTLDEEEIDASWGIENYDEECYIDPESGIEV